MKTLGIKEEQSKEKLKSLNCGSQHWLHLRSVQDLSRRDAQGAGPIPKDPLTLSCSDSDHQ